MFVHGPWRLPLINALGSENTKQVGPASENCRADKVLGQDIGSKVLVNMPGMSSPVLVLFYYSILFYVCACVCACEHKHVCIGTSGI